MIWLESTHSNGNRDSGARTAHGRKDVIEVEGVVKDPLPNAMFNIELANGHEVLAHISGKIRMHFIKILPGDRVLVEPLPLRSDTGRVTYRFK